MICPVLRRALEAPQSLFCFSQDSPSGAVTALEFASLCAGYYTYFQARGICAGDRILLSLPTSLQTLSMIWALFWMKASVGLINPKSPASALDWAINSLQPAHVFTDLPFVLPSNNLPSPLLSSDQLATFIQTSGSSGRPKWVAHALGHHFESAVGSLSQIPFGSNDRWLLSLPLHHVSGLSIFFRVLQASAALVMSSQSQIAALYRDMVQFEVTHVSMVTLQLKRFLDLKLGMPLSLRFILVGGGPVPQELLSQATALGVSCFETYGCSEAASQIMTNGQVLPHLQVQISETQTCLVKGKSLFLGYWDDGCMTCLYDENDFFDTGDIISKLDSVYSVLGRHDRQFISGGETLYPEEIEQIALESGRVSRACVVKHLDDTFGFRPVLYVSSLDNDLVNLLEYIKSRLLYFKVPFFILNLPDHFISDSGKISYVALQNYHNKQTF